MQVLSLRPAPVYYFLARPNTVVTTLFWRTPFMLFLKNERLLYISRKKSHLHGVQEYCTLYPQMARSALFAHCLRPRNSLCSVFARILPSEVIWNFKDLQFSNSLLQQKLRSAISANRNIAIGLFPHHAFFIILNMEYALHVRASLCFNPAGPRVQETRKNRASETPTTLWRHKVFSGTKRLNCWSVGNLYGWGRSLVVTKVLSFARLSK
jgi:hypothetical protein